MFRAFSRVDSVKISPEAFYLKCGVPKDDYAVFEVKPADAVTNEELRIVLMTIDRMKAEVIKSNGLTMFDMTTETAKDAKPELLNAQYLTSVQIIQYKRAELCKQSTRDLLKKCVVAIDNYKEYLGDALVVSAKSVTEIVDTMPAPYVEWLFGEVQKLSNLTDTEVLGV
jgi:hypothetical protein